jgi:hypothetical protein
MTTHLSRADVVTDAPARYAKQLVAHLGRKIPFTTDGVTSTVTIDGTTAAITVADSALVLTVTGTDQAGIARAEHALGSHLERFGTRRGLTVDWTRITTDTDTAVSDTAVSDTAVSDTEGVLR